MKVIEGEVITRMIDRAKEQIIAELRANEYMSRRGSLISNIVKLFLDNDFSISDFDNTHSYNLNLSFADTPKSRRELDALYDKIIPTIGLGMRLYRRVNVSTPSNTGRVYYKEIMLGLEGYSWDTLDEMYHTLRRGMGGGIEVDMNRIHVSRSGYHYPLPAGVSKYGYGYTLQYYSGITVNFSHHEYGSMDGAFESCVRYLKKCLKRHKLPIGCQMKESKSKKYPTGMAGVYATMERNSSTVRISVTMFQPEGKTKNLTIGSAHLDTPEYWEYLNKAKAERINNLAEEAMRQYDSLPTRII